MKTTMEHYEAKGKELQEYALMHGDEIKVVGLFRVFNSVPVFLVETDSEEFCYAGYAGDVDVYIVEKTFVETLSAEEQEAILYHEEGHRVNGLIEINSFEEYIADEIRADSYAVSKGYGHLLADTLIKTFTAQFGSRDQWEPAQRKFIDARVASMRSLVE